MKKLLLSMFLLGAVSTSFSQDQLYQSGINWWTTWNLANSPSNWLTVYGTGYPSNITPAPISKSTDASDLLTSLRLESVFLDGGVRMGFAILGSLGNNGPEGGVPFTLSADSIIFDAKYDIQTGDSANVYVILKNSGIPFEMAVLTIGGSQSTWKRHAFKINPLNLTPDSLILAFTSSDTQNSGEVVGSWIQIDNIKFANGATYSSPIPNPSFEDWDVISAEDANEWNSLNPYYAGVPYASAVKSTDVQEGAYAMNLLPDSVMIGGSNRFIDGIAVYGTFDENFNLLGKPFTASPTSMTGYYKWDPVNGAIGSASVSFQADGVIVGGGNFDFTTAQSTYTQFSIPLTLTGVPDTIIVILNGGDQAGSSLLVDNIQFAGGTVGIKTIALTDATIGVYPNPTSDDATLRIALPKMANVSFSVLNALGQMIQSENLGAMKDGFHSIKLNTSTFSTGVYFVKVKIGEHTLTQKVIVK